MSGPSVSNFRDVSLCYTSKFGMITRDGRRVIIACWYVPTQYDGRLHLSYTHGGLLPWHTMNCPDRTWTVCHGLMTSPGRHTVRTMCPSVVNSLILRATRHVTNRLCTAFTKRQLGSSFTRHCVAAPCASSLCIHSAAQSLIIIIIIMAR